MKTLAIPWVFLLLVSAAQRMILHVGALIGLLLVTLEANKIIVSIRAHSVLQYNDGSRTFGVLGAVTSD